MSNHLTRYYEFGPFRIDVQQRLLLHNGEIVPLTPKAFDTLFVLVQNNRRIVEKEALIKLVWPDTFVEESSLTQNIFTLRKALNEDPSKASYIETVPKRGYRFAGEVKEVPDDSTTPTAAQPSTGPGKKTEASGDSGENIHSLAVLPLYNATGDPSAEYLTDGITESLINLLSLLSNLRVIARSVAFRYKNKEMDPQEVGRELGVRSVLAGRMLQIEDSLIIRVELLDVAHGWHLWGEQYNREDLNALAVQEEIANHISERLRLKLTGEEQQRVSKHYTSNDEAYQLYLKGRYCWNKQTEEGYQGAIKYFEHAIEIDPLYALSYAGLADAYIALDFYGILPPWETRPKAMAAGYKAVDLDGVLVEVHTSLACIKLFHEHDRIAAEKEFKRAIELNPRYAYAHSWYSQYLLREGRIEESLAEVELALKIEPFDIGVNLHMGHYYLETAQYDLAVKQFKRILALDRNSYLARVLLGRAYEHQGKFSEAVIEFKKAWKLDHTPQILGYLGHAYAKAGNQQEALKILGELHEIANKRYVPPSSVGIIYVGLNESGQAFEMLEDAFQLRAG